MCKNLFLISLFAGLIITMAACKKTTGLDAAKSEPHSKIDACTLLKAEDIQEVQGATMQTTQPSEHSDGRLRVSQCYFAADPSNRSVSLAVTQSDPASSDTKNASAFWQQTFGAASKKEDKKLDGDDEKRESMREQARGGEEGERAAAPQKIDGVGEEAYWVGSRVGGALYVLKRNVFLRISLGGPDEPPTKIDKSKKLAQKALERF